MKRFFISFLGALAGIWVSLFLLSIGVVLVIAAIGASTVMGEKNNVKISRHSYLNLKLNGEITERPGNLDPLAAIRGDHSATLGLNEIVGAIREAASDDKIDGIVIECDGSAAGLAPASGHTRGPSAFQEISS